MARIDREHGRRLLAALPALCALAIVLVGGAPARTPASLLMALVLGLTLVAALAPRIRRTQRLRALANLLDALGEGDYAVRGAPPPPGDPHAELVERVNLLARRLHDGQRTQRENLQLLVKTLAALDGAVFAFEQDERLRLVNPAGERLLGLPAQSLLGRDAGELGLSALFAVPDGAIHAHAFPGQSGRWQVGHAALRSRSRAGRLLVLQPIERALREEEAQAFRRLLRVLSHEINNSMAPIASMADTLRRLLPPADAALGPQARTDLDRGLVLIEQRSAALQRFLGGYARLARLPAPSPAPLDLAALCARLQGVVEGARIDVEGGPPLRVLADGDQLEQVMINLLRNAREADPGGRIAVRWRREGQGQALLEVADGGPGPPASGNLFVPFFTTKPDGSGIGLVLSRQILEAQGGSLALRSRTDAPGAVAAIVLPLAGDGHG